jgi:starch synthase
MRITFVSAEMAPFAKVGGLADVAGALPRALADLGHIVNVYIPLYGSIDTVAHNIRPCRENESGWVEMDGKEPFQLFCPRGQKDSNLTIRFIASNRFFDIDGIYADHKSGQVFKNNNERFLFFQKAIVRRMEMAAIKPDVLHCNDHQTALLPYFIRTHQLESIRSISTVLAIHNLAYQGLADIDLLDQAGIPQELFFPMSPFEFFGRVNQLKAGLHFADKLITVSPTYASEIQQNQELGAGLQGVLRKRSEDLTGILNGVDYNEWNPATDEHIHSRYDADSLNDKEKNKRALRRAFSLPAHRKRVPMLGMVSRLVEQKGLDILLTALESLLTRELQVCILGTGDAEYMEGLEKLSQEYPEKLAVKLKYDNRLAHLIEAGADIYLMPSNYEPCGLNQMYSLRYGTIPVVRATGGLNDSVIDARAHPAVGTGIVFEDYSAEALIAAVDDALELYSNSRTWKKTARRAMQQDFSWDRSAKQYLSVYEAATSVKR